MANSKPPAVSFQHTTSSKQREPGELPFVGRGEPWASFCLLAGSGRLVDPRWVPRSMWPYRHRHSAPRAVRVLLGFLSISSIPGISASRFLHSHVRARAMHEPRYASHLELAPLAPRGPHTTRQPRNLLLPGARGAPAGSSFPARLVAQTRHTGTCGGLESDGPSVLKLEGADYRCVSSRYQAIRGFPRHQALLGLQGLGHYALPELLGHVQRPASLAVSLQ